jgi:hypothetical protein
MVGLCPKSFMVYTLMLPAGAGWRWFCWLCAIIAGLNFAAICLFVPETRFNRDAVQPPSVLSDKTVDHGIKSSAQKVEIADPSDALTGQKKTYLQELSLWSGVSSESFFSHFLRPYLLGLFPAVFWATVACKSFRLPHWMLKTR